MTDQRNAQDHARIEGQKALVDLLWREALRRCDGDECLAGVVLLDVLRECGLRIVWTGGR